jgi:CRP/FNR family transcriptional regulator
MPEPRPTPAQARLLRALREAETAGRASSFRDLAAALGGQALGTVRDQVAALKARGWVAAIPRQARSLRLTEAGRAAVARPPRPSGPGGPELAPRTAAAQELRQLLGPLLRPRSLGKGAMLWHAGDRADWLVLVDSGRLRGFRLLPDGRQATMFHMGPGDVIGFSTLGDQGGYLGSIQALEPVRLWQAAWADLAQALHDPRVAMALLDFLAHALARAFGTIEQLSQRNALPRVATALRPLMRGGAYPLITLPGPARAFADAQGLAPATLSRTLALLVRQGILHRLGPGRFQVLQPKALAQLAEGDLTL